MEFGSGRQLWQGMQMLSFQTVITLYQKQTNMGNKSKLTAVNGLLEGEKIWMEFGHSVLLVTLSIPQQNLPPSQELALI